MFETVIKSVFERVSVCDRCGRQVEKSLKQQIHCVRVSVCVGVSVVRIRVSVCVCVCESV